MSSQSDPYCNAYRVHVAYRVMERGIGASRRRRQRTGRTGESVRESEAGTKWGDVIAICARPTPIQRRCEMLSRSLEDITCDVIFRPRSDRAPILLLDWIVFFARYDAE